MSSKYWLILTLTTDVGIIFQGYLVTSSTDACMDIYVCTYVYIHTYIYIHTFIHVSWCGGESWVDQRVPQAYIHDVALLL